MLAELHNYSSNAGRSNIKAVAVAMVLVYSGT